MIQSQKWIRLHRLKKVAKFRKVILSYFKNNWSHTTEKYNTKLVALLLRLGPNIVNHKLYWASCH